MKIQLPDWLKLVNGSLDEGDEEVDLLMCEPIGFDPDTFTGYSSQRFGEVLSYIPKHKHVNLKLNTPGGYVNEGTAMYNLAVTRGNLDVHVIGYAASMGAVLLQAGVKRKMYEGTMVLVHPVGGGQDTDEGKKIKAVATQNIIDILAKRTGNRKNIIAKMIEDTTAMGPDEAKRMGFVDEIVKGEAVKNFVADPVRIFNAFQQLTGHKGSAGGETKTNNETKQQKHMQNLLKLLARLKLVASADVTEDQAIDQVESNLALVRKEVLDAQKERDDAKNELKTHTDKAASDQKARVTTAVKAAVTDKLVKAERETALVAKYATDETGLTEFLNDLRSLKGEAPAPRRGNGAPPVPPEKEGASEGEHGGEVDAQIAKLREDMKGQTPVEQATTARKIRDLRGHKNLFTPAVKA